MDTTLTLRLLDEDMTGNTKVSLANCGMVAGLLPYLAVLIYIALMSGSRGDAAMGFVFMTILGLGIAYVVALTVAFPAFLWSRYLAQSPEVDTRWSVFLRRAVLCGIFPLFAVFPCLARALFW